MKSTLRTQLASWCLHNWSQKKNRWKIEVRRPSKVSCCLDRFHCTYLHVHVCIRARQHYIKSKFWRQNYSWVQHTCTCNLVKTRTIDFLHTRILLGYYFWPTSSIGNFSWRFHFSGLTSVLWRTHAVMDDLYVTHKHLTFLTPIIWNRNIILLT